MLKIFKKWPDILPWIFILLVVLLVEVIVLKCIGALDSDEKGAAVSTVGYSSELKMPDVSIVQNDVELEQQAPETWNEECGENCPISIADSLTDEELFMLAQLVEAEAGDQDLYGMRLVVDVVLNRVDSAEFPDNIHDVIYQKNQFEVIRNGRFDRVRDEICENSFRAVAIETRGLRLDYGIRYFAMTPANGVDIWKHGDHYFGY